MPSRFLKRKLRHLFNADRVNYHPPGGDASASQPRDIDPSLEKNLREIKTLMADDCDLKIRMFRFGPENCFDGALLFFDGLADSHSITEAILRPVTLWQPKGGEPPPKRGAIDALSDEVLCSGELEAVATIEKLVSGCLTGDAALLVDGCASGLVLGAKGWDKRGVTEPQSETVVRGPREGFTENLRTNTALIRRKIKNSALRAELMTIGRKTQTAVCLMYLDGVADAKVLKELRYRLEHIQVDSILESGYIEEYIEDAPFSPFSTIGYSEKPDVAAARVLEGRIAVVVDGTPFVLTVPMLFVESFQSAEDYYTRTIYASMIRMLRYLSFMIGVFAPALYIALTSFHQELIPTTLLFTIASVRETTPFPVFIEMLIMVFAFEILRESGIRLPRPVGQAISIVGALVMGDAAVSAGLVGAPVVITIAITAVAGFMVPMQYDATSMLRYFMMILASATGFFGVAMGFLAVMTHLSTLSSFGVPYFDGFAWTRNLQDSVVRMPLWSMIRRPKWIASGDVVRRRFFVPPPRPHERPDGEGDK